MNNPLKELATKELVRAEAALREVAEPVQPISLAEFESKLLPLIRNGEGSRKDIERWCEVAGHPHVEIHVMDKDGNVKYVVPPLLNMGMTMNNGASFQSGSDYRKAMIASSPIVGFNVTVSDLAKLEDTITDQHEMIMDFVTKMNIIFKDYNIPLINVNTSISTEAKSESVKEDVPDLVVTGYDSI